MKLLYTYIRLNQVTGIFQEHPQGYVAIGEVLFQLFHPLLAAALFDWRQALMVISKGGFCFVIPGLGVLCNLQGNCKNGKRNVKQNYSNPFVLYVQMKSQKLM